MFLLFLYFDPATTPPIFHIITVIVIILDPLTIIEDLEQRSADTKTMRPSQNPMTKAMTSDSIIMNQ